jgi:hypothetical protein
MRGTCARPPRSTGSKPAASMLRRISSSGARRRPSARRRRRHAVDVVGAERQRHLRELRAVAQPVHLDVRHLRRRQARDRHAFTSS